MTNLQVLNRWMLAVEKQGHLTEQEYATYRQLLEAVEALKDCHARLELLTNTDRGKLLDAVAKQRAAKVLENLK